MPTHLKVTKEEEKAKQTRLHLEKLVPLLIWSSVGHVYNHHLKKKIFVVVFVVLSLKTTANLQFTFINLLSFVLGGLSQM